MFAVVRAPRSSVARTWMVRVPRGEGDPQRAGRGVVEEPVVVGVPLDLGDGPVGVHRLGDVGGALAGLRHLRRLHDLHARGDVRLGQEASWRAARAVIVTPRRALGVHQAAGGDRADLGGGAAGDVDAVEGRAARAGRRRRHVADVARAGDVEARGLGATLTPSGLPSVRVPAFGGFWTKSWLDAESTSNSVVVAGLVAVSAELV